MKTLWIVGAILMLPIAVLIGLYIWRKTKTRQPSNSAKQSVATQTSNAPQGTASPTNTNTTGATLQALAPVATQGLAILAQFVSSDDDNGGDGTEASG